MEKAVCFFVAICLFCTSCATMRYTYPPEIGKSSFNLNPGDTITLYFKDGHRKNVRFKKVEGKTIYYKGGKSEFKEVLRVRVKRFSWKKTTLVVVGGVAATVAALWFIIFPLMGDPPPQESGNI